MGGKTALGDIGLKASGKNDFNLQEAPARPAPNLARFFNSETYKYDTPQHMRRLDSCKSKRNAQLCSQILESNTPT